MSHGYFTLTHDSEQSERKEKNVIASDRRERGNLLRQSATPRVVVLARLRRLPRRYAPRNDIAYLKGVGANVVCQGG